MNVLGSRHHYQSQSRSTLTEHICIAKHVDSLAKTMTSWPWTTTWHGRLENPARGHEEVHIFLRLPALASASKLAAKADAVSSEAPASETETANLALTETSLVAMLELLMFMVSSLPHMIDR